VGPQASHRLQCEADIRKMISLNACRLMGLPEPQRTASAAPAARA
jgi:hypothetical protein